MFLQDPKKFVPGTDMPFAGVKSERERKALVCYLAGDAKASVCQ
jgi:cytochrome c2